MWGNEWFNSVWNGIRSLLMVVSLISFESFGLPLCLYELIISGYRPIPETNRLKLKPRPGDSTGTFSLLKLSLQHLINDWTSIVALLLFYYLIWLSWDYYLSVCLWALGRQAKEGDQAFLVFMNFWMKWRNDVLSLLDF